MSQFVDHTLPATLRQRRIATSKYRTPAYYGGGIKIRKTRASVAYGNGTRDVLLPETRSKRKPRDSYSIKPIWMKR